MGRYHEDIDGIYKDTKKINGYFMLAELQELESALELSTLLAMSLTKDVKKLESIIKDLGDECKVHRNKERNLNTIKAEGIGDMLSQFDMEEMADCEGQYLSVNLMYEYKRQLESKDE